MFRSTTRAATLVVTIGFALVGVATALANEDDVITRGGCSRYATWKLKAKPDDGRLEVEGEVDSNHRGQTWKWKILHDGSVSYHGTATTGGPSGSFEIRRRVVDSPGVDHIGWRARNPRSGERCRGGLSI
jgi:hypothetical protein